MIGKKDKPMNVAFANENLDDLFENLKNGDTKAKQLHKFIERAINDLKQDPACGIKIKREQWPKTYVKKYSITNLWKYDLPGAWRLIYTIAEDEVRIISVILEWMSHKDYDKRFGY